MITKLLATTCAVACLGAGPVAFAQSPDPAPGPGPSAPAPDAAKPSVPLDPAAQAEALAKAREDFEKSITRRTGKVDIAGAQITLTVPSGYYYLDTQDARKVLEDVWGNPRGAGTDGMLFPDRFSAMDEKAWGVVLNFEDTGYVSDEDAAKTNYDELLRQMQENEKTENPDRVKHGFPEVHVVGWAAKPTYDAKSHKLYWAKDITFGDDKEHTLNYDMRVLGRHGVLSMNFVAGMSDLRLVEQASPAVLEAPEFKQGFRYQDFDAVTDKKADFGVAGLVAGGTLGGLLLAKNTGIVGILIVLLKKVGIFLVAGIAGIGAWLRNMFGGKSAPKTGGSTPAAMSTDFFDKPEDAPTPPPSEPPVV